jgi:hypothetical protein
VWLCIAKIPRSDSLDEELSAHGWNINPFAIKLECDPADPGVQFHDENQLPSLQ